MFSWEILPLSGESQAKGDIIFPKDDAPPHMQLKPHGHIHQFTKHICDVWKMMVLGDGHTQ